MKIRFLADENLRRAVVLGVRRREPSIDFRHAFELGVAAKDDLTLLRIAADEGRLERVLERAGKALKEQFATINQLPAALLRRAFNGEL